MSNSFETVPNPLYPEFSNREFVLISEDRLILTEDEVSKAASHLFEGKSIYHDYAMMLLTSFDILAEKHPEKFNKDGYVVVIRCESCQVSSAKHTFRLWATIERE